MKKILFALILLFASPVFSAEEKSVMWSPDTCEFKLNFPEAPFVEKKCPDGPDKQCHEVATYTQVVDVASRVNVRVSCQMRSEDDLKKLNDESLKEIVRTMAQESGLSSDNIVLNDKDSSPRTATILSIGARNDVDVVYTGQVWVGKKSLLRLDAEMSGPQNKTVDEKFSAILKSLSTK